MVDEIVSYETARIAKAKGFDWRCRNAYWTQSNGKTVELTYRVTPHSNLMMEHASKTSQKGLQGCSFCTAPTLSLLQRWFREMHDIEITPYSEGRGSSKSYNCEVITDTKSYEIDQNYKTYEYALEKGLKLALDLV